MRWLSAGGSRAAVAGSTSRNFACSAGQPSSRACASMRERTALSAEGRSDRPPRSARA